MTVKSAAECGGGNSNNSSSNADLAHLSDEDYLVARSKRLRKSDPAGAKAWMITAKLMFPDNASIQYEAYLLEKEESKAAEAAKYLVDIFHGFRSRNDEIRTKLTTELARMVSALQAGGAASASSSSTIAASTAGPSAASSSSAAAASGGSSSSSSSSSAGATEDALLVCIYNCLPKETQQEVLLDAAREATDTVVYAKLMLLTFERFPKLIPTQGAEFLLRILNRCKKQPAVASVDPVLQLLIMEMCPKLLAQSKLKTEVTVLDDILQLTIQYCCAFLTGLITAKAALGSSSSSSSAKSPWSTIFSSVEEIGLRMGWSLTEDLGEIAPDTLWQRIQSFGQRQNKHDQDKQHELFFVAMLMFLRSLSDYLQTEGESILVEAFVTHLEGQSAASSSAVKRRRTLDDHLAIVTHGDEHSSRLIDAFLHAYRYYDLLRSEPGLDAKLQQFRSHTHFFSSFQSDVALYQGNFREASMILNALQTPQSPADKCRHYIKLATIQFCIAKHSIAAEYLMQAVACLSAAAPSSSQPSATRGAMLKQATASKSRHVHFLPFTKQHVLAYCARVLVYVLKDSPQSASSAQDNDSALGHVIVLLQYIYPEEVDLFYLLLNRIRGKDTFSYPLFCHYVVHVEFLEEFSALLTDVSSKVVLDITPSIANQRRMGTRGANRGEKEEIKCALKRQVLRSHESLDEILIDFLTKNKDTILSSLM